MRKDFSFAEAHEISSDIERQDSESTSIGRKSDDSYGGVWSERASSPRCHKDRKCVISEIRSITEQQKDVLSCTELCLLQEEISTTQHWHVRLTKQKHLMKYNQIISEIEAYFFQHFKQLRRITIHAEPK